MANGAATVTAVARDAAGNSTTSTVVNVTVDNSAPPPDDGPGGPILVLTSTSNPFTRYYNEILRAEGLNLFLSLDIRQMSAATLAEYDVVILGETALTAGPGDPVERLGERRRQPDRHAAGQATGSTTGAD